MTPAQLRKLLGRLGLNQSEAARLLGRSDRAMRNWLSGKHPLPHADKVIWRALAEGKITVEDVEKAKSSR